MRPPLICIIAALLLPSTAVARGRLIIHTYDNRLVELDTTGKEIPIPLPFTLTFSAKVRVNGRHHLMIVDRAPKPGRERIAIIPLDGSAAPVVAMPKKRVRHNRIIQLLRYLPSSKTLIFRALDNYASSYFSIAKSKRRTLKAFRMFRGKVFAQHFLADGRFLALHIPRFTSRSERTASRHYLRLNPRLKQTLYYGVSPQAQPRVIAKTRSFERIWLTHGGTRALFLVAGITDRAHGQRSYHLETIDLSQDKGEKPLRHLPRDARHHKRSSKKALTTRRVASLTRALRNARGRIDKAPPHIHVFTSTPYILVPAGVPKKLRLIDLRRGHEHAFNLPPHDRVVPLTPSRSIAALVSTTHPFPYLITQRRIRRSHHNKNLYEVKIVAIPKGTTVATYRYSGNGIRSAIYIPSTFPDHRKITR